MTAPKGQNRPINIEDVIGLRDRLERLEAEQALAQPQRSAPRKGRKLTPAQMLRDYLEWLIYEYEPQNSIQENKRALMVIALHGELTTGKCVLTDLSELNQEEAENPAQ